MERITKAEKKEIDLMISYFASLDVSKEEALFLSGLRKLRAKLK
jgi:hypothetical protein